MASIAPLIRAFVSSTFADFHAERNALQDRVFPALRQYARGKGARFLPIDLRWGVSEAASLDQRTVRICMEEIQRCQQASPAFNFIALLGDRYGSCLLPETIPQTDFEALSAVLAAPAQDLIRRWYELDTNAVPPEYSLRPRAGRETAWSADQPKLQHLLEMAARDVSISPDTRLALSASITEREIEAGIFQVATPDACALCFVRTLAGTPGHAMGTFREADPERRRQLADLQQRLRARMPSSVIDYTAQWNGGQLERADLDRFCTVVERQLRDRIDAAIADHERRLAEEHGQDLRAFPFARDRLAHFVGRSEPLAVIRDYLAQPATEPLVVTGQSGVGKTTLLLQAATLARAAYPDAEHVTVFIGGNTAVADVPGLLRDLYAQLLAAYPESGELPIAADRAELEAQAAAFLGLATVDHPLVLFVDGLDQLRSVGGWKWIPILLPPHVHLVVSLLPGPDADALRQRMAPEHMLYVGPLPEQDGAALLQRWLDANHRAVTPDQRTAILRAFTAYPNPLYLRLLALEASRWRSTQQPIEALPADTPGVLDAFFARLESAAEHGRLLVTHALGLVAAGKDGLAEDEVLDVLSQDQGLVRQITQRHPGMPSVDRCPPVLWARLYSDVEALLTERQLSGTRLLTFYHRQAEESARRRYLAGKDGVRRHRELARYFERPHQDPYLVHTPDRPFAVVNERMVTELAYQQHAGRLTSNLKHTLLDATFLQARIQAGGTASAVDDTDLASSDATIAELGQALRMSAHVLDQAPDELVNQLHGRTAHLDTALHHLPQPLTPHFRLLSRSLPRAETHVRRGTVHSGIVYYCALSRDGTRLLTASSDNTMRLWDVQTRRTNATVRVFSGHAALLNCCRFSPDEQYAISASDDATVRLWDIHTGSLIRPFYGHTSRVMDCRVTPDGQHLVSAALDGTLRLWDLRTGVTLQVFRGHEDGVNACAVSPDGRYLISGSDDNTLRKWDLQTGQMLTRFVGHSNPIEDCTISSDGKLLVSASNDHTLRLWDMQTGEAIRTFRGHTNEVWTCNLTHDGRFLLSSSQDATMRLWDVEHAHVVRTFQANAEWVLACAMTPDGRFAASASYDDMLRLWNLETGEIVWEVRGQTREVNDCTVMPDGVHALSASFDHVARLWDLRTGRAIRTFAGHTGPVQSCRVTANGALMVSASGDTTLRLWNMKTGKTLRVFRGHTGPVYECAITPDGQQIVSTSADRTLRLWDLKTGTTIRVFEGHTDEVTACALGGQGRWIVSASYDATLRMWDMDTGRTVRTFEGHTHEIADCALTPDGRFLLSAAFDPDSTLRLWEVETGEMVRVFRGRALASAVYDCDITPDGAFALSADDDGIVRLRNVETGDEVCRWVNDAAIFSCALHPTQPIVIAGDNRGGVHFLTLEPSPFGLSTSSNSLFARQEKHPLGRFRRLFSPRPRKGAPSDLTGE